MKKALLFAARIIGHLLVNIKNRADSLMMLYRKSLFKSCGNNVSINGGGGVFTYSNISIGDDVFIGVNSIMQSRFDEIKIGNHVAFGPCVHIFGANHDIYQVGKYMRNLSTYENGDIVIEDDCWIGSNVTILRGVRIGRGSVIGAGAVVAKDVPPYTIYTGMPGPRSRRRFTDQQIEEHEAILYGKQM